MTRHETGARGANARAMVGELDPGHAAIGVMLQDLYERFAAEPLPSRIVALLDQIRQRAAR
jgi:hypothetical protein